MHPYLVSKLKLTNHIKSGFYVYFAQYNHSQLLNASEDNITNLFQITYNEENIGHIVRDESVITSLSLKYKISTIVFGNLSFIRKSKEKQKADFYF